jgi:predicted phosphodiesterase
VSKAKLTAAEIAEKARHRPKSAKESQQLGALVEQLQAEVKRLRATKKAPAIKLRKGKVAKHELTVAIPDSHGEHIDVAARNAFLADLARIQPDNIVFLGDHLDCGGTFSSHQRSYTKELVESYDADVAATNEFLDLIQQAAPNARKRYLAGNHEQHCDRWVARNFASYRDARMISDLIGPEAVLRLKERGIEYYRSEERYDNISIPGTIKIGKLYYTHGISVSKHATAVHLERFGASVMHGHTHRAQAHIGRTVTSSAIGGYCPGTLAKLQPLYAHTSPTNWSHGYGLVTTSMATGNFAVQLIPIIDGESMLIMDAFARRSA